MIRAIAPFLLLASLPILGFAQDEEPSFELKLLQTFKQTAGAEPTALAYSPDSKWIATAHQDGSAWLWDVALGKPKALVKRESEGRYPTALAFSPDSSEIAVVVCGEKPATIHRIAVRGGKQLPAITVKTNEEPETYDVETIAYQPGEAKFIATGLGLGQVKLWDRKTGKEVKSVLPAKETVITQVEFKDGKTLISCGDEHVIRLLSVPDLKSAGELKTPGLGKIDSLDGFSLSADGRSVATCGTAYLQVWDLPTKKSTFLFEGNADDGTDYFFSKCALSADGKIFVAEEGTDLLPFSHADTEDFLDFLAEAHEDSIEALQFSPDGQYFATMDETGIMKIWRVKRSK